MYRGRLLFPIWAELAQLDTELTAGDPDGGGSLTSGYDPVFRTVERVADGSQAGATARMEKALFRLPCQMESKNLDAQQQFPSGNSPQSDMALVFHFADLERNQLLDLDTNEAMIRAGDRLEALYTRTGQLIQRFRNPPGLFAVEVHPRMGLGGMRNLLYVRFAPRETAT